jgi:EmrB/QacA subfamily drug resistance transporter
MNATHFDPATPYPKRWWALVVLCLSLLVISLDNTILNVALPTLVTDLSASSSQLQWMVDAYVLVFAGLLLTAGALTDRYGRRLGLFSGFVIFAVGSAFAAWSSSPEQLIAWRAVMGIGGALIMPSTLSILTNIFPSNERPKAIAIWTMTAGIGIPIGPVIGGWLLEHFWWGSVFLINIPIIVAALLAGIVLLPESKDPNAKPLDPGGALLSIAGLGTLIYAIIEAPNHGWTSASTIVAFGVAVSILTAFVLWERRVDQPMLDMSLFRNMRFTGASISVTLVFFAMLGMLFSLTQYLQFVLGYDPLQAGIRITPVALGIIAGAGSSTRLASRLGSKIIVTWGLTVVAGGLGLLSTIDTGSGYGLVAAALIVLGYGMGTAMAPATEAIMGAVPKDNAGVGSAVNDATRQVGGALGVAILGSLLSTGYTSSMEGVTANLPAPAASAANDSVGAAVGIAARLGGPEGAALASAARAAFIDGMSTSLLVAAGFALAGAIFAAVFLPAHAAGEEESGPMRDTQDEIEFVPLETTGH